MKSSVFTAMGLLALAGLGAAGPVAKEMKPKPQGFNIDEIMQPKRGGGGGGGGGGQRGGDGPPDHSRFAGVQSQQEALYYCKKGQQGDIGQICQQCGGTPVEDQSCLPSTQGCKGVTPDCFTDQKCQKEYGKKAKVEQCGKQSPDSLQNDQLLSTNQNEESGTGSEDNNMEA